MLKLWPGLVLLAAPVAASPEETYRKDILPILEFYCYGCHGDGSSKGKFSMDEFGDLSKHLDDREHWMHIWQNVRSQIMPPSDEDQLTQKEKDTLLNWIQTDVFKLDPENPDPGRVTIRRLNRTEYRYAVFDLLGVEFQAEDVFPPDDTGYGFDNIGDVLSISPLLMEKYIAAAEQVVDLALPKGAAAQVPRTDISGSEFKGGDAGWMPFRKKQTVRAEVPVKWPGDYQITVEYATHGATEATGHEAKLKVRCGEKQLGEEVLGWDQSKVIQMRGRVPLKKGKQAIEVELSPVKEPGPDEEELALTLQRVIVQGPLGGKQREYAKGYQMIFVDGPAPEDDKARENYARKIMRSFVSRAFRRPLDGSTIERLVGIVKEVDRLPGKSFEDGIRAAITTCLCSPRFLFRVEIQPEPNNPGKVVLLDEYALASRLSFFLWSSVPDDELLSLAFNKQLRKQLHAQIDRMLADPRSDRLVENFVGQWLQTRDLETLPVQAQEILGLKSKREASLVFDVRLREAMRRETEMLFDFVLREERPAEELISARYTFLNERLADYYGIAGVEGDKFVPVDLTEHPERGGVLTHGSYLIVSSNPTRTSPVKRGLFVLDNLLGTPAPPAPPGVPELEEGKESGEGKNTMREMMQIHRDKPDCRGCHARMDPIGLGLENFNALGQFRREENGKPIDAGGELITGEKFANVAELKEILAGKRRDDFYRCLAEKMLTYAIGRGVEYYDATTIDQLVDRMETHDGSLKELLVGIIESAPFQRRRGAE
ncbi:filamin [Haloferula helveola]|uniref:Filamin n=2 Tax=Haloferula helveola TaxID=490095 RepID=A0ABM7RC67_9BACT|nr:filamin [Haloferula helveola]